MRGLFASRATTGEGRRIFACRDPQSLGSGYQLLRYRNRLRDEVVVSTKFSIGLLQESGEPFSESLPKRVEESLGRLRTDYIDVLHIHALAAEDVELAVEEIVPIMQRLRDAGKIRFIALSEAFGTDTDHQMFQKALGHDVWDVAMVGFNIVNQSARETVFPKTIRGNMGTEIMFALRRALANPDKFRELIASMQESGELSRSLFENEDPLRATFGSSDPTAITEVSYRYAAWEKGADVVLTGTGNPDHLKDNVAAVLRGPLPKEHRDSLDEMFGHLDCVSGN